MTTTAKAFFRDAATTDVNTVLYTVPSATTAVVTNIVVTNIDSSDATFTLALNGTKIAQAVNVTANTSIFIDLKQVLAASEDIAGGASANTVNFHISGVEIT